VLVEAWEQGHDIYIAVCSVEEAEKYLEHVVQNDNFVMTLTYETYSKLKIPGHEHKFHVTCHYMENIVKVGEEVQKLYLVKDQVSYVIASWMLRTGSVKNVHLPIDQEWIRSNPTDFIELTERWLECNEKTVTIDSCAESYLLTSKCSYKTNYIDINHDGTMRRCPFEKEGTLIKDMSIEDMFKVDYKPSCIYHDLLGG